MTMLDLSLSLAEPNREFKFVSSFKLEISEEAILPHVITGDVNTSLNYLINNDEELVLKGNVRVPVKMQCDRCAAWFEKYLFLEIDEVLDLNNQEDQVFIKGKTKFLINDYISQFVLINFPSRVLCKQDCKGLCKKCGYNLNDGKCMCN